MAIHFQSDTSSRVSEESQVVLMLLPGDHMLGSCNEQAGSVPARADDKPIFQESTQLTKPSSPEDSTIPELSLYAST